MSLKNIVVPVSKDCIKNHRAASEDSPNGEFKGTSNVRWNKLGIKKGLEVWLKQ
jgi:hypothetical protein